MGHSEPHPGQTLEQDEWRGTNGGMPMARSRRSLRRTAQLEIIGLVSQAETLLSGDVEAAARQITGLAAGVTGCERVNGWLFNDDESELRCIDAYEASTGRHSSGMVLYEREYGPEFQVLKTSRYVDADDPTDADALAAALAQTSAGRTVQLAALGKNGVEVPVELSVATMALGAERHAVGILRDITERKQWEARILEMARVDGLTAAPQPPRAPGAGRFRNGVFVARVPASPGPIGVAVAAEPCPVLG
jgi:PAS domain-containing protein